MRRDQGFSLIELLVALAILTIVGGVAGVVLYSGNRTFSQESARQLANAQARNALEKAVRRLRECAARTARVNLSLDDAYGKPLVRDGLLVWTDCEHRTVYVDRDESGEPGFELPDVVGWDDRDGDGKSDVLALALMPEDEDHDGVQDFIDVNDDGAADDRVKRGGKTDGRPDKKWRLVLKTFDNLADALDPAQWNGEFELVVRGVVPFLTTVGGVDQYDTIEVEGTHAESYDYGHDRDFDTDDPYQRDGVVDEVELGRAFTDDSLINAQEELDLVGTVKVTVTPAFRFEKGRLDMDRAFTAVTPRAYAILAETGLQFPDPT